VDEVVLCFDSDEAGQNAAVRSLDHLLASGLAIRVAVVPAPHDPDSFIKANGGEAFRKLVEGAEGFFDYYLNRLCRQNDPASDKGRLVILHDMAEAVHKTGNVVLVDTYAQKTALRLGVSPEAVRAEFKKVPAAQAAPATDEDESFESAESAEAPRPSNHEFHLLKLLLLHEDLVAWAALHLDVNWISHPVVRQIVGQRLAAQANESWKSPAAFLDSCDSAEMRSLVTEAAAEDRKIPNPEQQLADVALKLRNQFLDRQIAALTQKASQPGMPEAEQNELLRERENLRGQKRASLSPLEM
jgi:DNA primase